MSTVIPIPAGAIAGLIVILVGEQVAAPEVVTAVAAAGVGLAVVFGWSMSDRLPNGAHP